jgi:hypothetical protein
VETAVTPAPLLTPEQAAEILNLRKKDGSLNVFWIYDHKKELGAIKVGGYVRIPVPALNAYITREPERRHVPAQSIRRLVGNDYTAQLAREAREQIRERRANKDRRNTR